MVYIDPEILDKTGAELFKELFRVYPVAEYEDYFKAGQWKDDLMKMDLQLIYAHARECGAPYPPPLEDIKFPDLPKGAPTMPASLRLPGSGITGLVRPTPLGVGAAAVPGSASAATTGPAAELRLIALFVAKWKLEPTRTKMALARLTAPKRRYVIQNFKVPEPSSGDVTDDLDNYIQECEKTDVWASATTATITPGATAGAAPKAGAVGVGVKRILTPTGADAGPAAKIARPVAGIVANGTGPAMSKPGFMGVRPPMMGARPAFAAGKGITPPKGWGKGY